MQFIERAMENLSPRPHPIGPSGLMRSLTSVMGGEEKKAWLRDGFVVLRNVFQKGQIDQYNAIVSKVRNEVDDGKDDQGYGDRIGQLHQREPDLLRLASSQRIQQFLRWAFNDDPLLMGSLQFEKGTQQEAHIDAIFFWPEPSYSMAGVWVALEDIHADAGPLFYIPGSHKWPFFRSEDVIRSRPDLASRREDARQGKLSPDEVATLVSDIGLAWTEELQKLERENNSRRVPICLNAGDVVIWHSLLAHGGSPRNDVTRSRRSAVFHYFGKRAKLFTNEQFALYDSDELPNQQPVVTEVGAQHSVEYMKFPHFVTYSSDGAIIHPV